MGTPRLLTDRFGRVVKKLRHPSFGVLLEDSFPDLFLPIGFAGGLMDADTGLVRFGWRDYDPKPGRFTAPDPANDRRGDGDFYDYCVDTSPTPYNSVMQNTLGAPRRRARSAERLKIALHFVWLAK